MKQEQTKINDGYDDNGKYNISRDAQYKQLEQAFRQGQ